MKIQTSEPSSLSNESFHAVEPCLHLLLPLLLKPVAVTEAAVIVAGVAAVLLLLCLELVGVPTTFW